MLPSSHMPVTGEIFPERQSITLRPSVYSRGCPIGIFSGVRELTNWVHQAPNYKSVCKQDILHLRRVPLTGVIARELWLLSPWGTWQYFRILNDRLIEIRADGTPVLQGVVPGVPPSRPVLSSESRK
ncbi:MAG: hypothetical protein ABSB80_02865 [Methanoregula sp.]|uniref:hypothetical protein n=1 Tax=Methanoregula sp. TaxID=2052170 RepID=UPI003D0F213B